ncbi:Ankyrin repeats (3 copies) [Carpediemonas membranifera]|uniref:Ankyrin repeats (3 copies) n=1 Tax=Carpediemonas membranifera TaxID=201153 RepID=A0A8J6BAH9_9EUKA|nr:Ankyrin repeats (3 copies) [Carpediemonas membranifera]QNO39410.1 vacuolar protein sorting 4D [Carpediemonas membranifera]|eukprot:KAG9396167.1 Ankyrin repeats (3 copies) [Carpediemonas membranifera]
MNGLGDRNPFLQGQELPLLLPGPAVKENHQEHGNAAQNAQVDTNIGVKADPHDNQVLRIIPEQQQFPIVDLGLLDDAPAQPPARHGVPHVNLDTHYDLDEARRQADHNAQAMPGTDFDPAGQAYLNHFQFGDVFDAFEPIPLGEARDVRQPKGAKGTTPADPHPAKPKVPKGARAKGIKDLMSEKKSLMKECAEQLGRLEGCREIQAALGHRLPNPVAIDLSMISLPAQADFKITEPGLRETSRKNSLIKKQFKAAILTAETTNMRSESAAAEQTLAAARVAIRQALGTEAIAQPDEITVPEPVEVPTTQTAPHGGSAAEQKETHLDLRMTNRRLRGQIDEYDAALAMLGRPEPGIELTGDEVQHAVERQASQARSQKAAAVRQRKSRSGRRTRAAESEVLAAENEMLDVLLAERKAALDDALSAPEPLVHIPPHQGTTQRRRDDRAENLESKRYCEAEPETIEIRIYQRDDSDDDHEYGGHGGDVDMVLKQLGSLDVGDGPAVATGGTSKLSKLLSRTPLSDSKTVQKIVFTIEKNVIKTISFAMTKQLRSKEVNTEAKDAEKPQRDSQPDADTQPDASTEGVSLEKAISLAEACLAGDLEAVKKLIAAKVDLEIFDDEGDTPLLIAVMKGHTKIAQALVNAKADCAKTRNNGASPLFIAAQYGQLDIVKLLLDANPSMVDVADNKGYSPLHAASASGHTACARLLLDRGADVNHRANYGRTPLIAAAIKGHAETIALLIEKQADLDQQAKIGDTALMAAIINGHTSCAELLIEAGADTTKPLIDGCSALCSALYIAAGKGFTDIAKLLLDANPSMVDVADNKGYSPLHAASASGHTACARLLLDRGADINLRANDDRTPLIEGAFGGHAETIALLIEKQADLDQQAKIGDTALMAAIINGHTSCAELLIEAGADPDLTTLDGRTALMCAAEENKPDAVRLLLQAGGDINARRKNGSTAAFAAAEGGFADILDMLIAAGADTALPGEAGKLPREIAQAKGHERSVDLLDHPDQCGPLDFEVGTPTRPRTQPGKAGPDAVQAALKAMQVEG